MHDRSSAVPDPLHFDPRAMLRTLAAHEVRFVVIGGFAAVLHGSALFTADADVTPDPEPGNLGRLCAALREMDARIRTVTDPEGLPFKCDETFLLQLATVNLRTTYGDFDLSFRPAAFEGGYEALAESAVPFDVGGFVVQVAALPDIIRSKETADRDKDRAALPMLRALQDEIAARRQTGGTGPAPQVGGNLPA
jgi:hypothetical protein